MIADTGFVKIVMTIICVALVLERKQSYCDPIDEDS